MDNSHFSNMIYRIIDRPEDWHDDYIDIMHQVLDETDSFDHADNFAELEAGRQILSRLKLYNETLIAFSSLLDGSRSKMIMLDEDCKPIYHNKNAAELHQEMLEPNGSNLLKAGLMTQIKKCFAKRNMASSNQSIQNQLMALAFTDRHGDQLYLRPIQRQADGETNRSNLNLLMVLDRSRQSNSLNADLVATYQLTDKEQMVLINLVHGKTIKDIAADAFVTENTVKTHLKSLFRKTGTKSQADIVRLILTHESQVLDSYFSSNVGSNAATAIGKQDKYLSMHDGYEIAYREYGPSNGHPVIVFHNGDGCRVTIPHNYAKFDSISGYRIIIPDRPGFGKTAYIKEPPEHWCERLNEFVCKLKLKRYDVLGTALGCPLAITFASQADSKLKRLVLSSPVLVNTRSDRKHMAGILAPATRLVRVSERFAKEVYELWLKSVTLNLGARYRSMLESSFGEAERGLFARQNTVELMVEGFRESSGKSLAGIAADMIFALSPRNLKLADLKIPVELWWGTQDNRITREGVEKIAASLPNSKLKICEGYSEHLYYAKFNEMLRGLN
ncbi:MAG: pimeloyl-ACP methyl ester carboxylesterase/DNA-binding CsgD family transcriptional regulator [Cryomorphaceae bacterium]|jgi:pimeloyl-ACP methyl ester carboxylesterase/DNA-binding CsgD family transcriptional regulator